MSNQAVAQGGFSSYTVGRERITLSRTVTADSGAMGRIAPNGKDDPTANSYVSFARKALCRAAWWSARAARLAVTGLMPSDGAKPRAASAAGRRAR